MLWSVLSDFRRWGSVRTVTSLNAGFRSLPGDLNLEPLPADEVLWITPEEHFEAFENLVRRCDAVLIIAPETDGILARLCEMVEAQGVPLLGSSSQAVAIAADKAECYRRFESAGLPVPRTLRSSFTAAEATSNEIGFPLVAKPVDGVGSEGVCLANGPDELALALASLREATRHDEILLQNYLPGTHASVSLLAAKDKAVPLSLNRQEVEPGIPFNYHGGCLPLAHPLKDRAFEAALAAVRLVPGLRGYVGVDLVLTDREAFLIEINPRLTTSYIGLRRALPFNLAQVIWSACRDGILPGNFTLAGPVAFLKDDPRSWGLVAGKTKPDSFKEFI